ncbi:hypothetical protein IFM89_029543 [Coptis chinensis]|uniref:25S rRNA (uridine-N(3))-methyltransferase BMT5-like domain-containing protein n=1 Tax=Coptis chinensis TaxID=261450 RepID=A0A835LEX5_9MAGN|nr:hypothetical protein IFM89_029543 [Coptis chinensis]
MGQVLAKIRKLFTSLIKIIVYCKSGKTRSSTSSVSESLISTPNVEEIQERVISTVPDSHIISITREYEEESIDASPSTNVTVEEKKQFTTVSDAHIGNIYEENEDISKGSEQLKEESQSDAGTSCDDINVIDERGQVITIQDAHERKGSERIAQDSQINNSVTSIAVKEDRDSIVQKKAVPKPPEKKIIWIKHYCSSHKILLVGEGDFSFSACLANVFGSGSNMVATSLNSKTFLKKNYAEAMSNIKDLKSRGCTLIHNFDATAMWKNWNLLNLSRFDRIIFNFPLVGLLPGRARKKQLNIASCKSGRSRISTSSVNESLIISTPNVEEVQERVISTVQDSHLISIPREYEEESIDASLGINVTVEESKQVTTVPDAHIVNICEENENTSKGSEQLEDSQSDAGASCDDIIVEEKEQDTITIRNTKRVIFQEENVNKTKGSEQITQDAHYNSATSAGAKWVDIVPIKVVVEEPKEKAVWIKHYCSSHKILLVGEGDFSFSACLARAFGSASNMVATSLNSKSFLKKNYSKAMSNINDLKNKGCTVIYDFDATAKWDSYLVNDLKFDRIIYNFPLAGFFEGQSEKCQLKRNQHLVRMFMQNAKKMLQDEGEIHITHKSNGFFLKWDLEDLAKQNGLELIEDVKFKLTNYPGYNNKYGFGGDENFNCNPSRTYKFGLN